MIKTSNLKTNINGRDAKFKNKKFKLQSEITFFLTRLQTPQQIVFVSCMS